MAKISVVMGIYNCADTLEAAVDCVFAQTFTDWELIMCDDGSSDNTYEVAEKYASKFPEKVVLLRNEKNQGLNRTLNRCLELANGEYIARMDGDDLCSPDRFEKELNEFQSDSSLSIVSSSMSMFDENGTWGEVSHPEYPQNRDFVHGSPFCHAPCLVKKTAYDAVGGYSEGGKFLRVEDYHLWLKMYSIGLKGKNIAEPLYQMRDDRNAYSRRKFKYRLNEAYVRILSVKQLGLPLYLGIHALRPVIVGLLPGFIYKYLHRRRLTTNT